MRKVALAISIILCVWFNYAHAGFEIKKHRGSPAAIKQRYRRYIRGQIRFLNNLSGCRPSTVRLRNPEHPNIILIKQILGRHNNFCRIQKTIINTSRANPSQLAMLCYLRSNQIRELTSAASYHYIRTIAKRPHPTDDITLEAPSMLTLERSGACRQHRDINVNTSRPHLFRK